MKLTAVFAGAATAAAALTGLAVATPTPAQAAPIDLCAAVTTQGVAKLRESGALTGVLPQAITDGAAAALLRAQLGCGTTGEVDPAVVVANVCAQLSVGGLNALADQFGATPGVRANFTPERVAAARVAIGCDTSTPATDIVTTPETTTPATSTSAAPTSTPAEDSNCADFPNQAAAQIALDLDPSDPNQLDADDDGQACEDHFADFGQVGEVPAGSVNTGRV